jgi:hypothetical protein
MEMYSLTGKTPLIYSENCDFLDIGGIFPPIFQCILSTTTFNRAKNKKKSSSLN